MKRSDILLLILGHPEMPIVGTTRLQKLVFLAEKEADISPDDAPFDFEPYKFGPVSKKLYDDIEFLLNIGYIEKSDEKGKIQEMELDDLENLSAEDFLSDDNRANNFYNDNEDDQSSVSEDTVVYRITKKGIDYLKKQNLDETLDAKKTKKINNLHRNKSWIELMRYVYLKYPEFSTESEIKDEIL